MVGISRKPFFFILLILFFGVCAFLPAQSNRFPNNPAQWTQVVGYAYDNGAPYHEDGDRDNMMVIFFEVPADYSAPLYFGIRDPENNGNPVRGTDQNDDFGEIPSMGADYQTRFYLIGGEGAFSDPDSRLAWYDNLPRNDGANESWPDEFNPTPETRHLAGQTLQMYVYGDDYANNNNGPDPAGDEYWVYFNPVSVSQGELVGNKRIFKIVAVNENTADEGITTKNGFQAAVSATGTQGSDPTMVTGARAFSYSITVDFQNRLTADGVWDFYPFIPDTAFPALSDVIYHVIDMDSLETPLLYRKTSSGATIGWEGTGQALSNGNDNTNTFSVNNDNYDNGTWHLEVTETNAGLAANTTEIWFTLDASTPVRIYSSPFTLDGTPPYRAIMTAEDGIAVNGGTDTELITFQIVDSADNPVDYQRDIYVSVNAGVSIDSASDGGGGLPSTSYVLQTDSNGYGWIRISSAAALGTETVSAVWDGSNGSSDLASISPDDTGTLDIEFIDDYVPEMTSGSNQTLTMGTGVQSLDSIQISHPSVTATITAGNDLYIRIPSTVTLEFDAASFPVDISGSVTGTGTVGSVYATADPKVVRIDVATTFVQGDILDIPAVLNVDTGTASVSSGYLQLSYDNQITWIDDSMFLEINSSGGTTVWDGSTDNDWSDDTNWSNNAPSSTVVAIVPDVTTEPHILAGTAAQAASVVIQSASSLTLESTGSLAIAGDLVVDGSFGATATSSGAVSIGGNLIGAGTFSVYNGNLSFTAGSGSIETDIGSNNGNIVFSGNITLLEDISVSSVGGTISFAGDINAETGISADSLTLDTGGAVSITGNVGSNRTLGAFAVSDSGSLNVASVTAEGDIALNSSGAITLNTSTIASTVAGRVLIDTNNAPDNSSAATVTLAGDSSIQTNGSTAGDDIYIEGTVNGNQSLTLYSGDSGALRISGDVGGTTRLSGFVVNDAASVELQAVGTQGAALADTISVGATGEIAGSIILHGDISTAGVAGNTGNIAVNASSAVLLNPAGAGSIQITTNGATATDGTILFTGSASAIQSQTAWQDGVVINLGSNNADLTTIAFTNLDHLHVSAAAANTIDVPALTTGADDAVTGDSLNISAGTININGNLATNGEADAGDLTLSGNVVLQDTAAYTFTTDGVASDGTVSMTGDASSETAGTNSLNIIAGLGNVYLGHAGTPNRLGTMTVTSSSVCDVVDVDVTGDIALNGGIIQLSASSLSSSTNGVIRLDSNNADDGSSAASIFLLAGGSTITTALNAGDNVDIEGAISRAQSLQITAGAGDVSVTGTVGVGAVSGNRLTAFSVISSDTLTVNNIFVQTGGIALNGTTAVNLNASAGAVIFSDGGGIAIDSDNAVGGLSTAVFLTGAGTQNLQTTNGQVYIDGSVDNARTLSITAGTGDVTLNGNAGGTTPLSSMLVNSSGTASVADITTNGNIELNGSTGITLNASALNANGSGYIRLDDNNTDDGTDTAAILLASGAVSLTTNGAANYIDIEGAVNGFQQLSLNSGTGDMTITGSVGITTALDSFDIQGATNVDINAVATGFGGAGNALINIGPLTGNLVLRGDLLTNDAGAGTDTGNIQINGPATVYIDPSAGVAASLSIVTDDGGAVATDGQITLTGVTSFESLVAWEDGLIINTGDNDLDFSGFSFTNLDHLHVLAGTGNTVSLAAITTGLNDVGTTYSLNAVAGTIEINDNLSTTGETDGADLRLAGNVVLMDTNTYTFTTNGAAADGAVSITGTVISETDNTNALTITADTGDVTVGNDIGTAPNRLTTFTVSNSGTLSLYDITTTGNISLNGSTGITLNGTTYRTTVTGGTIGFTGPVTVMTNASVSTVGGNTVSFNGTVTGNAGAETFSVNTATGNGTVNFQAGSNAGSLGNFTVNAGTGDVYLRAVTAIRGSIAITGGDGVASFIRLYGNLSVSDTATDLITMTGDVLLGANVQITETGNADDDISFAGTIDGAASLTMIALADSDITINGAVGGTTPLTGFTINNANTVNIESITTSGTAALAIGSAGAIAALNIGTNGASALSTAGAGVNSDTGNININSAGAITLLNNVTFNTDDSGTGTDGSIAVNNTIDGGVNLGFTAGGGAIDVSAAIGSGTAIDQFSSANGAVADFNNINAANISIAADSLNLNGSEYRAVSDDIAISASTAISVVSANETHLASGGGVNDDIVLTGIVAASDINRQLIFYVGAGNITLNNDVGTVGQPFQFVSFDTLASISMPQIFADNIYFYDTDGFTFVPAAITFNGNLQIYVTNNSTVAVDSTFTVNGNWVVYAGEFALNQNVYSVTGDLVIFGAAYDADSGLGFAGANVLYSYDNPERNNNGSFPGNILADYKINTVQTNIPVYQVGGGLLQPIATSTWNTVLDFNVAATDLTVSQNFYANGADLGGANTWNLNIPDNDDSTSAFAEAYNCNVAFSTASPGWVAAAEGNTLNTCTGWDNGNLQLVTGFDDDTATDPSGVLPGFPVNTADAWRPTNEHDEWTGVAIISDNVIRLVFDELVENSRDEIWQAVSAMRYDDGSQIFQGAYTDPSCQNTTTAYANDLRVFYLLANGTWNTDAIGGAPANPLSTDRSGTSQTALPVVYVPKADAAHYITLLDEHKNRITHYMGGAAFTGALDHARPVLLELEVDRDMHMDAIAQYDGRNYFRLLFSEPVDIGNLSGGETNIRAETTFADATQHGGHISAAAGTVTVAGFFSYTGAVNTASLAGNVSETSLWRNGPLAEHQVTIYLNGYYNGSGWDGYQWNVTQPPRLTGDYTFIPNVYINDKSDYGYDGFGTAYKVGAGVGSGQGAVYERANPNPFPIVLPTLTWSVPAANYQFGVGGAQQGWDIIRPEIAKFQPGADTSDPGDYEVLTVDRGGDLWVDHLELHILDNPSLYTGASEWNSTGPPGVAVVDPVRGVCEESIYFEYGGGSSALDIPEYLVTRIAGIGAYVYTNNDAIDTDVNNGLFGNQTGIDDEYFSIAIPNTIWPVITRLQFQYLGILPGAAATGDGAITDLAGNIMYDSGEGLTVERIPPEIAFAISQPGNAAEGIAGDEIYVHFTEPVAYNDGTNTGLLSDPALSTNPVFVINGTQITAGDITVLETAGGVPGTYATGILITLPAALVPLSENDIFTLTIRPYDTGTGSVLVDQVANHMDVGDSHRLSDVGIGLIDPVFASDGVHTDALRPASGDDAGALRDFDGTGRLLDQNITLEIDVADALATETVQLFYDFDPNASYLIGPSYAGPSDDNPWINVGNGTPIQDFWLPQFVPGFIPVANMDARTVMPFRTVADIHDFTVNSSDPKMVPGATMDFLVNLGGLYCARLADPTDLRSIVPYKIRIEEFEHETAGVTIINNVINPLNNEITMINFENRKAGLVTVQVFNWAGDLVNTLQKGRQGIGTFTYTWDGRNHAGRAVAVGLYFIRVVGPDVDEYRKVLVVK